MNFIVNKPVLILVFFFSSAVPYVVLMLVFFGVGFFVQYYYVILMGLAACLYGSSQLYKKRKDTTIYVSNEVIIRKNRLIEERWSLSEFETQRIGVLPFVGDWIYISNGSTDRKLFLGYKVCRGA